MARREELVAEEEEDVEADPEEPEDVRELFLRSWREKKSKFNFVLTPLLSAQLPLWVRALNGRSQRRHISHVTV